LLSRKTEYDVAIEASKSARAKLAGTVSSCIHCWCIHDDCSNVTELGAK
jgi:hypothetical protein